MECFRQCPRKYYLSRIKRIRRANQPRQLEFGLAFHKALEEVWLYMGLHTALEVWAKEAKQRELSAEDRIVGEVMLVAYHTRWGEPDSEGGSVFVENKFKLPVYGPDGEIDESMVFVGILDVELETHPLDHKTTRSDLSTGKYESKLPREPQAEEYILAMRDKGVETSHAVWDVIRCPELRRRKKTPEDKQDFYKRDGKHGKKGDPKPGTYLADETLAEFRARFAGDVMANPDAYLQRYTIRKTQAELDARRGDIWMTGKLIQAAIEHNAFPRSENGCAMFDHGDGRNMCEYEPICWQGVDPYTSDDYITEKKRGA